MTSPRAYSAAISERVNSRRLGLLLVLVTVLFVRIFSFAACDGAYNRSNKTMVILMTNCATQSSTGDCPHESSITFLAVGTRDALIMSLVCWCIALFIVLLRVLLRVLLSVRLVSDECQSVVVVMRLMALTDMIGLGSFVTHHSCFARGTEEHTVERTVAGCTEKHILGRDLAFVADTET